MKTYTITLDEKQMELVRTAMRSQVEISSDVATHSYKEYMGQCTDDKWEEFANDTADLYVAMATSNMLEFAKEDE